MRIRGWLLLTLMLSLLPGCMQAPVTSTNADPYRWLESPVTSPPVQAWLQQQAQATHSWQQQQPDYQQFRQQLHAAWDYPKWMVVAIQGDQVFFYFNPGLDDHFSLYQQSYPAFIADRGRGRVPAGRARKLLGADIFDVHTSPGAISISPDAQWLAYQINRRAPSGNQQSLWYLQSLVDTSAAPVLLSLDHAGWTLPAEHLTWGHDGGSVFFTVSVPPVVMAESSALAGAGWQSRVYALRLNESSPAPELVYTETASRHITQLHANGSRLLIAVADAARATGGNDAERWAIVEPDMAETYAPVSASWLSPQVAGVPIGHSEQYIGNINGIPAFISLGARGTGAILLADAQRSRILVSESEAPLHSALVLGQKLVLEYLVHGSSMLQVVDLDGRPVETNAALTLPSPVRIEALRAISEHEFLVSYSGMVTPPRSVLVDLSNGHQTTLTSDQPGVALNRFRASLYRVDALDGTRIPVWVAESSTKHDRDHDLMLMEVYGGFATPMETSFSISRLAWLASGGAYAIAGPRGGGDYGVSWHEGGRGERRHNSITDVLAVAGWLRDERLTEKGRLAISGRSHGGLLATEAVHRAPDMFAALVTDAAVFDLRRLDAMGGARFWQQEYQGTESSPYHALLTGDRELSGHPPALLITRVNDAVVAPAHSFKYVQALQAQSSIARARALLAVTPGWGHEASGRVADMIDDYALRWTFLTNTWVRDQAK